MKNYCLLLEYESGLSHVETMKRLWFGKFKSKEDAILHCHFDIIMPEICPEYIEFEGWLEETQGEEFASDWRKCLSSYESKYKDVVEKINRGIVADTIPINVIEINSPVEENSLRVLLSGSFEEIKPKLTKLLIDESEGEFLHTRFEEVFEVESEDGKEINLEQFVDSLSMEKFTNLIDEYIEWKNDD